MKSLLWYLLEVILVSGLLYGYYHLALRNKRFHRYNRFYLLGIFFASLLIPFLNIPLYLSQADTDSSFVLHTLTIISSPDSGEVVVQAHRKGGAASFLSGQTLLYLFYAAIALLAFSRLLISMNHIRRILRANPAVPFESIRFVNTDEPAAPFSFFRWLFWNRKIELQSPEGEQIFRHELFHIEQKHSWDVMATEIITAIFWVNPFFHLAKKEVKAIHEFLADQFAITENKKWEYAELLLKQALHTRQSLVNPFFHNQIKRRIAMITISQKPGHQYLRKLMALPLTAAAVALFAFTYKHKKEIGPPGQTNKTITVVLDAGHGGKDEGVQGADGTLEKDIVLSIAKKVKELNTDDHIRIILTRNRDEFPSLQSRVETIRSSKADLFLSLHINAAVEKTNAHSGVEVTISRKNEQFNAENQIFASILSNYFSQLYTTNMEAIRGQRGIYVLDNAPCPSALIQCGYMTNEKDLAYIKSPANQEKMAGAILSAIDQYALQRQSADWEGRKETFAPKSTPSVFSKAISGSAFTVVVKNKQQENYISFMADSIVVNPLVNTQEPLLQEALYIFNGQRKNASFFENKAVQARLVRVFPRSDAATIKEFGTGAENGVIVFENALLAGNINPAPSPDTSKPRELTFDKVEVEPSFPGGDAAWRKYLESNLDANIPLRHQAPPGAYSVVVMFIVDKEGNLADVRTLTHLGYGMEEEALRVIKAGPKWLPALQNGKVVRAYRKQPITFVVQNGQKEKSVATQTEAKPVVPADYPRFPGGEIAWQRFLMQGLNANVPIDSAAPAGNYKVLVQFLVHADGTLSDFKPLTKMGYGMEQEVIRALSHGPKWEPAMQNGKKINAYIKQPVTFSITEETETTPSAPSNDSGKGK